jgi:hypothetical protein
MNLASVTVPTEVFLGLVQAARAWQRQIAWEEADRQAGEPVLPDYIEARRLTSVERCGISGCDRQVELQHPWPRWQIALLPDVSWVRCPKHERSHPFRGGRHDRT